ncbi:tetratricopeptide repeat protein [Candidatus Neptunochlamydia vexilliferae]|nr:bacterial transcriptional activator domain-containing protein [Candidatus Neptunochlamydia vexilliferae]
MNKLITKLLPVVLFPSILLAGIFDWFFSDEQMVTQFECPHRCGEWGSEGMQKVEWQAVLALWELDRLSYACQNIPFSYALPISLDDPWYRALCDGWIRLSGGSFTTYFGGDDEGPVMYWGIKHGENEKGNYEGATFWVEYYPFSTEKNEYDYEDFEVRSLKTIKRLNTCIFSSLIDNWRFYWNENHGVELDSLDGDIKKLKKQISIKEDPPLTSERGRQALVNLKTGLQKKESKFNMVVMEGQRIDTLFERHMPLVAARLDAMMEAYSDIQDQCITQHNAPMAYLNRARCFFDQGDNMSCIADIKKLLEITPPELLNEKIVLEAQLRQGRAECELDLFDDAIATLSTCIANHPRHKEAHIERAIAYFEKGDFHAALQDYAEARIDLSYIPDDFKGDLEFFGGVVKGITLGATEALVDFGPALLSSAQGLSHGLWAFTTNPKEASTAMLYACKNALEFIQTSGCYGTLKILFPEMGELLDKGKLLSYTRQGELIGQLIGRYGVDFLLFAGAGKALKAYRGLRRANATLSLEKMTLAMQKGGAVTTHYEMWWKKAAPMLEELKATKPANLGRKLNNQVFKGQALSETQVRKVLHHLGYRTPPRPKKIPRDVVAKFSKKGGGIRYVKPGTTENQAIYIRVMPGNPKSPNLVQRKPYVIQRYGKKALSRDGRLVEMESNKKIIHIPLEEYEFKGW